MSDTLFNLRVPSSSSIRSWLGIAVVLVGMVAGYVRLEDSVRHNHEDTEEIKAALVLIQDQHKEAQDSAIAQRARRFCAANPGAC